MATIEDFDKIDIRLGRIVSVEDFPEARVPSYRIKVDFGEEIGIKKSCGHFPQRYKKEELQNRLVLGVVNFPPRQIGPAVSEVLIVGVPDEEGQAILVAPDREVPLGGRLY